MRYRIAMRATLAAAIFSLCLYVEIPAYALRNGVDGHPSTPSSSSTSATVQQQGSTFTATAKKKMIDGFGEKKPKSISAKESSTSSKSFTPRSTGTNSSRTSPRPPSPYELQLAKYNQDKAAYLSKLEAWRLSSANFNRSASRGVNCTTGSNCPTRPLPPTLPTPPTAGPTQPGQPPTPAPAPIQLTPQQVAEIAAAQLTIPTVKPGIGPPPEINQWNMAVVGYPLWLWADGPTQIGPVGETVGTQSVSLSAQLTSVTYTMGDGHKVSCNGPGTPWTRAVTAGAASPTCGYHYEKASLPNGDYTVIATATWSVTATLDGQTIVLQDYTNSTRQLPVGELQAVVAHG